MSKPPAGRLFSDTVHDRLKCDPAFREAMFDEISAEVASDFAEVRGCLGLFHLSTEALDRIQKRFGRRSGALRDIECQTSDETAAEVARESLAT